MTDPQGHRFVVKESRRQRKYRVPATFASEMLTEELQHARRLRLRPGEQVPVALHGDIAGADMQLKVAGRSYSTLSSRVVEIVHESAELANVDVGDEPVGFHRNVSIAFAPTCRVTPRGVFRLPQATGFEFPEQKPVAHPVAQRQADATPHTLIEQLVAARFRPLVIHQKAYRTCEAI